MSLLPHSGKSFSRYYAHRFLGVLLAFDTELVELLLALTYVAYGLGLFLIDPRIYGAWPAYAGLRRLAPPSTWGVLMAGVGAVHLTSLLVDEFGALGLRRLTAIMGFAGWVFLLLTCGTASWRVPITPVYALFAAFHAWVFVRLRNRPL